MQPYPLTLDMVKYQYLIDLEDVEGVYFELEDTTIVEYGCNYGPEEAGTVL